MLLYYANIIIIIIFTTDTDLLRAGIQQEAAETRQKALRCVVRISFRGVILNCGLKVTQGR